MRLAASGRRFSDSGETGKHFLEGLTYLPPSGKGRPLGGLSGFGLDDPTAALSQVVSAGVTPRSYALRGSLANESRRAMPRRSLARRGIQHPSSE